VGAFGDREPKCPQPRRQITAGDVFGNDVAGVVLGAADVMDGHDVRMVEVGDGAGFAQIGLYIGGPSDPVGMSYFNGDGPI